MEFQPGSKQGKPVRVRATIEVNFQADVRGLPGPCSTELRPSGEIACGNPARNYTVNKLEISFAA